MERQISIITPDGYPYYLHDNREFVAYWKEYFEKYPIKETDRIEIYIDFPFCRSICNFCVYGSLTISEYKDRIKLYEDATVSLISDMRDIFPTRINNVYFGGGTPTLWSREALLKITNNIPGYLNARTRTIEAHPIDLTEEWMDFVINELNVKTVSIGVQSFDIKSNKEQNRAPVNINKLKNAVEYLHNSGIYVNIDIVALFNEDNDRGWDLFKEDLDVLGGTIKPDDICSSVNFRVRNYYSKSVRYRQLLKEFMDRYPAYSLEHPDSISLKMKDIIDYGEEPYHLRTASYHEFFNSCRVGILDHRPEIIKENIVIGFGGSNGHNSISRSGMKFENIYSYFNFNKNRFIHKVTKVQTGSEYNDGDKVPNIRVGNCNIDSTI